MAATPPEQTILLVDQDHDFLDWATKHLEAKGLSILRCDNAENAVKIVQKATIDLVITDLQVQPFDGLELVSRIRSHNSNALVVLTAGFPTTTQIIEATSRGARDVLRKESLPFDERERLIIGSIARYHRKALPKEGHVHFAALEPEDQGIVRVLASLVRVADGLDRTHWSVIEDLWCSISSDLIIVHCAVSDNAEAERIEALDKGQLLEQVLNRRLAITWERDDGY